MSGSLNEYEGSPMNVTDRDFNDNISKNNLQSNHETEYAINNNNHSNEDKSSFSPSTQQITRKSKNLKNLNLNLNSITNRVTVKSMEIPSPQQLADITQNIRLQSPLSSSPSPTSTPIIRSPSIFRRVQTTSPSSQSNAHRKRSTTLALNIPSSSSSSSSPTTSNTSTMTSTLIENELRTPLPRHFIPSLPFEKPTRTDTSSSTSTLNSGTDSSGSPISYSSEIKSQTIMHSFNESKNNDESHKIAYSKGPICVMEPNLYLYSEPTLREVTGFQVIINVAQEIKDYSQEVEKHNSQFNDNIEYYFIPWTHTSKLTIDFPNLTNIIDNALKANKKVLIHCQCGVSRSASLIMAYFMKVRGTGYNDAYSSLKEKVPQISPNLSLIYELIEWGEQLENKTV